MTDEMRPFKLVGTKSFENRIHESLVTDDIPWEVFGPDQYHYEFVVKLGDGHEAVIIVSEETVNERPEYFRFVRNESDK